MQYCMVGGWLGVRARAHVCVCDVQCACLRIFYWFVHAADVLVLFFCCCVFIASIFVMRLILCEFIRFQTSTAVSQIAYVNHSM